jgi:transcription termination/antitermination protein NusA
VAHALSPARVTRVIVVDAQARVAQVIVPDYQLSLAIGKEGQNVRLAARLTGWRIDIRPDSPGADAPVASAAPEDTGRAGSAVSAGEGSGPGQGDGALASAVSDVPGSAGTGPGAPDAGAL